MAWLDEQAYDETYILDQIDLENTLRANLAEKSDNEFLDYVLDNSTPDILNKIVPENRFRAYDIALECRKHHTLTSNQRIAITNVFVHKTIYNIM